MKVNPKFLMMMAALVAGTASAATNNTTAGTVITNTATASYDNPDPATSGTTPVLTANSNEVKTTVLPKPDFDIVYSDNPTTLDGNTYATTPASKTTANAVPGQKVETVYSVINYGNVALTVALGPVVGGDAVAADVKYYLASDTGRTNALTSITLPVDDPGTGTDEGLVSIVQVITVPTAATPSKVYGASPEGSVVGTGVGTVTASTPGGTSNFTGNGIAGGVTAYEEYGSAPSKTQGTDLQFAKVTLFQPNVDNQPNPTGTAPTTPVKPDGTAYTPTVSTTPVKVPTQPAGPVTPIVTGDPNNPTKDTTTPGYLDGTTPIDAGTLAGDLQKAYPKANDDNLDDVVIFTNSLKNNGTQLDKLQLFPVNTDGTLLTGATWDATNKVFTLPGGIKVEFLNPDSTSIPVATGALYPTITSPAGSTAYYRVKVTYPDADDSAPIDKITVRIGADSLNDVDVVAEKPTTGGLTVDEIYPAAAQFGDFDGAAGTSPTPTPVEVVIPNGTNATNPNTALTNAADSTAIFQMDLVNNGTYSDSYVLRGTVTFPSVTPGGADVVVAVRYYDSSANELPKNTAGNYVSPVVAASTEIQVTAVIDVPAGTPKGDYRVTQIATGSYSTIAMQDALEGALDNRDIIRISPFGKVGVGKFVYDGTTAADTESAPAPAAVDIRNPDKYTATGLTGAQPTKDITYRIIGKNTYNTAVSGFFISDTVPPNTKLKDVSLEGITPAKTIYRVGTTGTWINLAATPIGAQVAGTVIQVALDNNNNLEPDALPSISALPAGSNELSANFVVTVK